MILVDRKKEQIKIDGNKPDILTELSMLVDELRSDLSEDEIMYAVKIGMTRGDMDKMCNILIDSIKNRINKIMEENNEDTKEDNI